MTRQLDKVYRLDHAVTKTQKVILSAFGMDWNHVKYRAENISRQPGSRCRQLPAAERS